LVFDSSQHKKGSGKQLCNQNNTKADIPLHKKKILNSLKWP